MEEAAAVRRAASEATADVVPAELRETIEDHVADGSAVPGALTLLSARAVSGEDPEAFVEQAAGVQLIYDGLRLTRAVARSNPWREPDAVAAGAPLPSAATVSGSRQGFDRATARVSRRPS